VSSFLSGNRKLSLVDRVSIEVMPGRGLDTAFAFDSDFRAAGFRTVP
jgi:predicted nucleic acid-binding protein